LPWLEGHIWPEEDKHKDPDYADSRARAFFRDLAKCGTVIAAIYSSIHEAALRAAFRHAMGRMVIGNVIMTSDFPPYLRQDPAEALQLVARLANEFGGNYAVTPRFAPSCSAEVLKSAGKIARDRRAWIQTHLSENHDGTEHDEVELVKRLFPDARDYTDVYERAGLLGDRAIMAHAIHVSDSELRRLSSTGTNIAHCPTSNIALESGTMPLEKVMDEEIAFALGSDVGAGPSLSMLHVMKVYGAVHAPAISITPTAALYRATLAGAKILGVGGLTGNLNRGKEASFAVLRRGGTRKIEDADELMASILEGSMLDLENVVQQTYIAGRRVY
jgi:guanine deaminase